MYAKTNVGVGMYLGTYSDWLQPGTSVAVAFGQELRPREHVEAWEVTFFQGINNGADYETQAAAGCYELGNCIQGDAGVHHCWSLRVQHLPHAASRHRYPCGWRPELPHS